MIEMTIQKYLTKAMRPVKAYMEEPENPPDRWIEIEKTGGGITNHIPRATLAIKSHAPSMAEAAKLNHQLKIAMLDAISLDSISKVTLNSDYNFTDTTKHRYRYQAVFDITYFDEV